jgi:hypothetical protein
VRGFLEWSAAVVAKTIRFDISMHDLDRFTKNLLAIGAELREAHVIYNAMCYVKSTARVAGTAAKAQKQGSKQKSETVTLLERNTVCGLG